MNLKYQAPPDFEHKSNLKLLKSENEFDKINGLLSIVLKSGNYDLSMKKSIEFSQKNSEWVKACGIECFGHIARLYKKIELDSVQAIITSGLKSKSKIISGKSESAIDDIVHFLKLDRELFK